MLSRDSLTADRPAFELRNPTTDEMTAEWLRTQADAVAAIERELENLPFSNEVEQALSDCRSLVLRLPRIAGSLESGA